MEKFISSDRLISVIVPIYNAERYLTECVNSVLQQDYNDIELLLIDDGSTDESYRICLDLAEKDNRIRVFHNENHGISYTRNFGIDLAKGELICFIDADDKIFPDFLSTLYSLISSEGADVAFCGYRLLYGERFVNRSVRIKPGVYTFDDFSHRAIDDGTLAGILFGSVCSAMYKSALIKESGVRFDTSVHRNEDGLFNLQLLPVVNRVAVSDYTGYLYRKWKKTPGKQNKLRAATELHAVSDVIREGCSCYADVKTQLDCREVSIAFWDVLKIGMLDVSVFEMAKQLKSYVSNTRFDELYHSLDFDSMNKYKRFLAGLIYKKHYILLFILLKYVKPILVRFLKY